MSASQAIRRLKHRLKYTRIHIQIICMEILEIFSFLFAFSFHIFLSCRFSLKVHASGSRARQETAKRAMNGTYSQTGDAATPPVVWTAKKMQCQQQSSSSSSGVGKKSQSKLCNLCDIRGKRSNASWQAQGHKG